MKKTALVTGTSRGIGKAIAENLNENGYTVYGTSTSGKGKISAVTKWIKADFSTERGIEDFIKIVEVLTEIKVLINNAGVLVNKPFDQLSRADYRSIMDTNYYGVINMIQLSLSRLSLAHGQIINIGSVGGLQGSVKFPGLSIYSSSKGALSILTECLALELSDYNVKVNCLALGAVQTEMLNKAFPGYKAPLSANEVSTFIVDFCINGGKYFNGKVIPLALTTP